MSLQAVYLKARRLILSKRQNTTIVNIALIVLTMIHASRYINLQKSQILKAQQGINFNYGRSIMYRNICEVREVFYKEANHLLRQGWTLLTIAVRDNSFIYCLGKK